MSYISVNVPDDVVEKFVQMQLGKRTQYMLMNLTGDFKALILEKAGEKSGDDEESCKAAYEDFCKNELKENECRYIIFDMRFTCAAGERDKLIFMSWAPDMAPMKQKMAFTSAREDIKRKFNGIAVDFQATDMDDCSYSTMKEKALRHTK